MTFKYYLATFEDSRKSIFKDHWELSGSLLKKSVDTFIKIKKRGNGGTGCFPN